MGGWDSNSSGAESSPSAGVLAVVDRSEANNQEIFEDGVSYVQSAAANTTLKLTVPTDEALCTRHIVVCGILEMVTCELSLQNAIFVGTGIEGSKASFIEGGFLVIDLIRLPLDDHNKALVVASKGCTISII